MSDRDGVSAFITTIGTELAAQGFPRIPAFVIVALTASDDGRLTAVELRDRLGVSAAAISGAIRYLSALRFVRIVTEPGGRRHVYELGETPWYTASLDNAALYRRLSAVVRSSAAGLDARSAAKGRADELASFFDFLERRMPALLTEWDEERSARGRGAASG